MATVLSVKLAGYLIWSIVSLAAKPQATTPAMAVDLVGVKAAGLTVYWQSTAALEPHERLSRMVRLDENLYLLTNQSAVVTLDAKTGMLRWSAQIAQPDIRVHGPTHGPGLAYFASISGISGFDRASGELKMRWKGSFTPAGPALCDGQTLYVSGINGRMYAVRLSDFTTLWQFMTDGMASSRPVLAQGALFVASQGGKVYACQAADKQQLWIAEASGPILADLSVSGDSLYVAGTRQSLDCYESAKGRLRWRLRLPGPLYIAPRVIGPRLYQYVDQHGLWCLDRKSGKVLWRRSDALDVLAEHTDLVWLRSNHGSLQGVDKATGRVLKEFLCPAQLWASNEVDDAIYVATPQGKVLCLRPWEAGYLRHEQIAGTRLRPSSPSTVEKSLPTHPTGAVEDRLKASEAIPPIGGTGVLTAQPSSEVRPGTPEQ